ncbi:MAG: hypothetical protein ACI3VN_01435 [Candidatus Onthomonas sp.]
MKKTRLFVVEGIPGSGKSTTSSYLADLLRKRGEHVVWIDEGTGDHPADYEFHSFLTEEELNRFFAAEQSSLNEYATEAKDGLIVPLKHFSGDLLERLLPYKIYDGLAWEQEAPLMLDKWREYVRQAEGDTVYVFNCCLLQNPMCETMIRFGFEPSRSEDYINQIMEIIAPLNPAVLYLKQSDVKAAISHVCWERPESWRQAVIRYHTEGAYGRRHGLRGLEGYISCLEERQRREMRILEQLSCRKLLIEDAQQDWDAAYERIAHGIDGIMRGKETG